MEGRDEGKGFRVGGLMSRGLLRKAKHARPSEKNYRGLGRV